MYGNVNICMATAWLSVFEYFYLVKLILYNDEVLNIKFASNETISWCS